MERSNDLKELFSLAEQLIELKADINLSEREKSQRKEILRRRIYFHEMRMHIHEGYLLLSFLRKARWKFWRPSQWLRAHDWEGFLSVRGKFENLVKSKPFFYGEEKDLSQREKIINLKREMERARNYIENNSYH